MTEAGDSSAYNAIIPNRLTHQKLPDFKSRILNYAQYADLPKAPFFRSIVETPGTARVLVLGEDRLKAESRVKNAIVEIGRDKPRIVWAS